MYIYVYICIYVKNFFSNRFLVMIVTPVCGNFEVT